MAVPSRHSYTYWSGLRTKIEVIFVHKENCWSWIRNDLLYVRFTERIKKALGR